MNFIARFLSGNPERDGIYLRLTRPLAGWLKNTGNVVRDRSTTNWNELDSTGKPTVESLLETIDTLRKEVLATRSMACRRMSCGHCSCNLVDVQTGDACAACDSREEIARYRAFVDTEREEINRLLKER